MYDQTRRAMDEDGSKKQNVVAEMLPLINILSEDDFLVASPFRDTTLEDFRLSGFSEGQIGADVIAQREQKLHISPESMEPRREINVRKSLVWDSGFFTNAGVLDFEELSVINKGFGKNEAHILPGIQEDVRERRPAGSDSTSDGYGFSLDSTELDIFGDRRAFNQTSTLKKLHLGSRMVNSMPASGLLGTGSEKIKESASVGRPIVKATRCGQTNSSSVKVHGTKPVSAPRTKSAAKSGSGQSLTVSKKSGFEDSCMRAISFTPSLKPSSSVSFTCTKNLTVSCSSHFKSGGPLSRKSSSNSVKRKPNVPISTSKTPAKYSTKDKSRIEKPVSFSTHYKSISSCTSPSNSIVGCSSETPSSASTANQRCSNSDSVINAISCSGAYLGNGTTQAQHFQNHPCYQSALCEESLSVVCVQNASMGTDTGTAKSIRDSKPSGLRMPSPKIGFFDEEKHMVPAVRGSSHVDFEVQSASPYIDRDTKNKTADTKNKTGVLYASSGMKPRNAARFQELDNSSPKVLDTSRTKRSCLGTSRAAQDDISPAVGTERFLKSRKVTAGVIDSRKFSPHSTMSEEREGIIESKGRARLRVNNISTSKGVTGVRNQVINSLKKEHGQNSQYRPENDLHLKETSSDFEDQVNGLATDLEVIDLNKDLATEPKRKRGYSNSHCYDNSVAFKSPLCHPTASTRTPLAEKNSVWNRGGLFGGLMESPAEKAAANASTFPSSDSTEKENC